MTEIYDLYKVHLEHECNAINRFTDSKPLGYGGHKRDWYEVRSDWAGHKASLRSMGRSRRVLKRLAALSRKAKTFGPDTWHKDKDGYMCDHWRECKIRSQKGFRP